jgi:uncharacterized membrane protein
MSLPLLALYRPIPGQIWPYALSSACVEAVYYSTLVRAYTHGDFSLVYPVARGAAPALLAIWATLFLGERLQRAGVVGLILVLIGLLYVGALREVSIVLAALAGWRWLGEAFGALRTVGALLIFVGIVVIATAG